MNGNGSGGGVAVPIIEKDVLTCDGGPHSHFH